MNPNQQAQQNQKPREQEKWTPSERTIFLLQSDDLFEKRAREHIEHAFPRPLRARVTSVINVSRLRPDTEIVVAYMDPAADIIEDGKPPRPRRPARRVKGQVEEPAELPQVLLSAPVACSALWQEDPGDEDGPMGVGGVQLRNLYDERTGKDRLGLISRLTEACFGETARGRKRATVRIALRDDIGEITVRAA